MRKKTKEIFIKEYIDKFGNDKYDFSNFEYLGYKIKSTVKCNTCGHMFPMSPCDLLRGHGCPKCKFNKLSKLYKKTKEQFVEECRKIHGDKYDYSEFEYKGNHTNGIIKCNTCGHIFESMPSNHLNKKQGCPQCSNRLRHTKERFVEDCNEVYGKRYTYDNFIYVNWKTKGMVTCQKHGDFPVSPNKHKHGRGCPICKQSYLEREIHTFLQENNIEFEYEEHLKGFGKMSVDFYLPEYNTAIECQGIQHFKPVEIFGGENEYKLLVERDKKKYLLCEKSNVKLLYFTKVQRSIISSNEFYNNKTIFINIDDLKKEIISLIENKNEASH